MYIETSLPRQLGDYAVLSSPEYPFRGYTCVTFYYHMYGATIGNLTVTLNGRTIFSISGNQGNRWLKAQVTTFDFGLRKVGDKNFHGVAVSRYGIGSTCWNWPPSLIGNGELDYFAQFCPAKRQRKAVNYFLGFDKEPQRHKMLFTKYSILLYGKPSPRQIPVL